MTILAIDTSCDDTSAAVTQGVRVQSNVVSSQVRYHKKYGGVVPFLAQRLHQERIDAVVTEALKRSDCTWSDIQAIAVTYGPGLAPALQVGIAKAKELAAEHMVPLYAVNHMAGHIASCLANRTEPVGPVLAVLVSGGHSELVLMPHFGSFEVIGETLDDALGEAYDKVGRMLGLGYPAGPLVAKLADEGDPNAYELPVPMIKHKDLNMSYSGLKNAVRLLFISMKGEAETLTRQQIADICASFQRVAQLSLLLKLGRALDTYPEIRTVLVGGGVAANTVLRAKVRSLAKARGVSVLFPSNAKLCIDNAAMIGVAAYLGIQAGQKPANVTTLERVPGLRLGE